MLNLLRMIFGEKVGLRVAMRHLRYGIKFYYIFINKKNFFIYHNTGLFYKCMRRNSLVFFLFNRKYSKAVAFTSKLRFERQTLPNYYCGLFHKLISREFLLHFWLQKNTINLNKEITKEFIREIKWFFELEFLTKLMWASNMSLAPILFPRYNFIDINFKTHFSTIEYIDWAIRVEKSFAGNCYNPESGPKKIVELKKLNYTSYMLPVENLNLGEKRLLETDNPIVLPTNNYICLYITSTDVLHSWAIPSLGIKVDACPGRLNQTFLYIKEPGTYYGQCSEICGVNHAFMPIHIEAISFKEFNNWLLQKIKK